MKTDLSPISPLRFVLFCALLLLAAVWLEPFMGPFNRATAVLSGKTLAMFGFTARVRGDLISLAGFNVRIVSECTSLYGTLLLAAFILATPASWLERLAGITAGGVLLSTSNLLRIAAVTIVGATRPELFEVLHVYLGQVVMLLLVVGCCLAWNGRVHERSPAGRGFIVRCLVWGSLLFFPWLFLNVSYMKALDAIVVRLFALAGHRLVIPYQHLVYYQTFNIVLLGAFLLAERRLALSRRLALLALGTMLLSTGHLIFRVGNVLITAFGHRQLLVETSIITVLGSFMLPAGIWLAAARHSHVKEEMGG